MKVAFASSTHVGRRANNEDAFCAAPHLGLFAVADGMGGYEGGEVASRSAIEALLDYFGQARYDSDITWPYLVGASTSPEDDVARAVKLADLRIAQGRRGRLSEMGSTVALVRLQGEQIVIGHVGDSRVYRLRDGELESLTQDHSYYAMLAAAGFTELPPRAHLTHGNVITRALGCNDSQPDLRVETVRAGDTFLVCTDGLHDVLPEDIIAEMLEGDDITATCTELVTAAYTAGGRDNITAVVIRCHGATEVVAETPRAADA